MIAYCLFLLIFSLSIVQYRILQMSNEIRLGLSRILSLLSHLSNPQETLPIIHIAGTNGKGSVSAILDSIFLSSGLSTGRFNSPHLIYEWDCIRINGKPIKKDLYFSRRAKVEMVNQENSIGASSFEILTATAFEVFRKGKGEAELDLAIVEVGMGGSEDATNVMEQPLMTIITSIDLDHQAFLGNTIEEIARAKAGILKSNRPCVASWQGDNETTVRKVLEDVAKKLGCETYFASVAEKKEGIEEVEISLRQRDMFNVSDFPPQSFSSTSIRSQLPLLGPHQLINVSTAVLAIQLLRTRFSSLPKLSSITDTQIVEGIESTTWEGRLSKLDVPLSAVHSDITLSENGKIISLLLDGAHNPSSSLLLHQYLASLSPPPKSITFITALSSPRTPSAILSPLLFPPPAPKINVIATRFSIPAGMPWVKCLDPQEIVEYARGLDGVGNVAECEELTDALRKAEEVDGGEGLVVVCGSLYLVSDVYRLKTQREVEP